MHTDFAHIHTHVHTCAHPHTRIHASHTHIHVHAHTYTCTNAYLHTPTLMHTHAHSHVHKQAHMLAQACAGSPGAVPEEEYLGLTHPDCSTKLPGEPKGLTPFIYSLTCPLIPPGPFCAGSWAEHQSYRDEHKKTRCTPGIRQATAGIRQQPCHGARPMTDCGPSREPLAQPKSDGQSGEVHWEEIVRSMSAQV